MAGMDVTLRFARDDCALQTMQNLCRAAMVYLEQTPAADWSFAPAEVELMREMATEVEACTEDIFAKTIQMRLQPVFRRDMDPADLEDWMRVAAAAS